MRAFLLIGALGLSGCCLSTPVAPESPSPAAAPVEVVEPAAALDVRRSPASPPPRFSAPWPSDLEALTGTWPADAPPREQSMRRLCAGDGAAFQAWTEAATRAGAGTEREALVARLSVALEYCASPALCDGGRRRLEGATGLARDLALLAVAACGEDRDAAIVDVDGAPAAARLRFLTARSEHDRSLPVATPGHLAATRALLEQVVEGEYRSESRARGAVITLRAMEGGPALLGSIVADLPPHARAMAEDLLARQPPAASEAAPVDPEASEACVRAGGYEGRACLFALARVARARAVEVARSLDPSDDEALREGISLLVQFPDRGALEARLRELGLVGAECAASDELRSAATVMIECGRATQFDPETGTFPVGHDALLAELALLAPGVLEGVVFEEIAPEDPDDGRPYLVRAYLGGERFETSASALDDWYDLAAVLRLVNEVARARGSDVRWSVIEPTAGNDATIAAAPERALQAAFDAHLLEAVSSSASAEARDQEAEMIQRLIEGGALQ